MRISNWLVTRSSKRSVFVSEGSGEFDNVFVRNVRYVRNCVVFELRPNGVFAPSRSTWPQPKPDGTRIMVDSDNSMSLSFVTRRRLFACTAMTALAWSFRGDTRAPEMPMFCDAPDPALLLWEEWRAAALETEALCQKQQRLETALVRSVGFPRAAIRLPDDDENVTALSLDAADEIFGSDREMADLRADAEAEFAAHEARWDAADQETGYSAAKREEEDASDREQDLVEALTATPAISLAGLGAKLDAILHEGESWAGCTDFPWPHIRSALADLVSIGQLMRPGAFIPGSDRKSPYPHKYRDGCCVRVSKAPAVDGPDDDV